MCCTYPCILLYTFNPQGNQFSVYILTLQVKMLVICLSDLSSVALGFEEKCLGSLSCFPLLLLSVPFPSQRGFQSLGINQHCLFRYIGIVKMRRFWINTKVSIVSESYIIERLRHFFLIQPYHLGQITQICRFKYYLHKIHLLILIYTYTHSYISCLRHLGHKGTTRVTSHFGT